MHTRYERTYGGLPVLGGDLVVDTAKSGATERVTKATKAAIKVATLSPAVSAPTAEKQALGRAAAAGSAKAAADRAPRKVIWAASGKPVLAYETVVGGLQDDGTPNELHVITDAATGKKLYEYQGIETGTGNTQYSGTVTLGTTQSGSNYTLTDGGARRPQDVQPEPRDVRHRHAVLQTRRHLGQRHHLERRDGRRRRALRRGRDLGLLQEHVRPQRHQGQRRRRLLPGALRQLRTSTRSGTTAASA